MRRLQVYHVDAALLVLVAGCCDLAAALVRTQHGGPDGLQTADTQAPGRRLLVDEDHIPAGLARQGRNCFPRRTRKWAGLVKEHEREADVPADVPAGQQQNAEQWERPLTSWPNETKRMRELESAGWKELPQEPYEKMPPKMAIMMFASDRVNNEQVWINWLERAKKDGLQFRLFIHTKGLESKQGFHSSGLLQYLERNSVSVQWCNMWSAQMMLMRRALQDRDVSHMMVVSRDSIPVKPLSFIYKKLEEDPNTRMCADDSWRGVGGTPRAESWWLMRREDALLFVDNSLFVRRNFITTGDGCPDEQAWYYPLKMREEKYGREIVRNECVMFTDWADGTFACKDWMSVADNCKGCDELRSSSRTEADHAHPVTFLHVNASAMKGLMDSPFWFARKFEHLALQPDAVGLLAGTDYSEDPPVQSVDGQETAAD